MAKGLLGDQTSIDLPKTQLTVITQEPVDSLTPHPENGKYFSDMAGEVWEAFLEDIKENGITEPLTIDEATRYIIKGNQRHRAAVILQLETVPCIVRPYEDEQDALDDLIRDNAMRRDMGLLDKYKLVGHLKQRLEDRRGGNARGGGENKGGSGTVPPRDQICQILGLHKNDVTAALFLEGLDADAKAAFFEWVNKYNPSKTNLYEKVKELKAAKKELDDEKKALKKEIKDQKARIKDLEHLEEEKARLETDRQILDNWKESDPKLCADSRYFADGMKHADKVIQIMTEELAYLRDMPMSKQAAMALHDPILQILENLTDYKAVLFQKYIAVLDDEEEDDEE